MEWGEHLEFLQDVAKETGRTPPALECRVIPRKHEMALWRAFQTLSAARQPGMNGISPISLADIAAYCDLCGMSDADRRLRLCRIIQKMDAAYREEIRRKAPNPTQ